MKSHNAFFNASLRNFVSKNHGQISDQFGEDGPQLTPEDLFKMMEVSVGPQMRALFERKGRIDESIIKEIAMMPKSERTINHLSNLIARAEIGMAMNKPIYRAMEESPSYGPLLDPFISAYRRVRMRREMLALSNTAIDIEKNALNLMAAVSRLKASPTEQNKVRVRVAIKTVNKSLLKAHRRARIGSVWALRSGFSGDSVMRAMNRLYMKRMKKLSPGMARLDEIISSHGIKSEISKGIDRRHSIINREMMMACANPNLLRADHSHRRKSVILQTPINKAKSLEKALKKSGKSKKYDVNDFSFG